MENNIDGKRAVIYCRVSTQEQVQKDALEIQIKEAEKVIEENGWVIVDRYVELESGTSTKGRSQYIRMLEDMRLDRFDIIVIKSLDRLNRSAKNWYLFVDELVGNDKLLYIYMDRDFYKADDNLITGIKAILAEQYSRDLSKKINNAHTYRQKNGTTVLITNNTYGYRKKPDKSVEIEAKEAEMIREIFNLAAKGYGSRSISTTLYNEGIRNRNGNQLSDSSIRRIIKNPLFKGIVVMNRRHQNFEKKQEVKNPESEWIYHKGLVPAIVNEDLWEKANQMLSLSSEKVKRKKSGGNTQKEKYYFSGLIRCGCCGAAYYKTFRRRYVDKEEIIIEWKCATYLQLGRKKRGTRNQLRKVPKQGNEGCDNIHLKETELIEMMDDLRQTIFSLDDANNLVDRIMKNLSVVLQKEGFDLDEENITKQLSEIRRRKEKLLDLLIEDVITKYNYQTKITQLELEERRYEDKMERFTLKQQEYKKSKNRLEKMKEKLLTDGCQKIQIQMLMNIVSSIQVFPQYLIVNINPAELLQLQNVSNIKMKSSIGDKVFNVYEIKVPVEKYFKNNRRKKERGKKQMIEILENNPQITNKALAKELGISFSKLRRWLEEEKRNGIVYFNGKGGKGEWIINKNNDEQT